MHKKHAQFNCVEAQPKALRHRPLEITGRVGAGYLTGSEGVPAAERFFGGNIAVPFLMGDGWDLRGSPVLRSFPASSFSSVGTGAAVGGEYFVSFNLTASMPFWVRPLVPSDVTSDPFVRMGLNGQLDSAENTLRTAYKIADPAHQRAVTSSRPSKENTKHSHISSARPKTGNSDL